MRRAFAALVVAWAAVSPASAAVKLPNIFSSHMVLQREMPVPVWGWADPGEQVTVTIAGQSKSVTARADGKWMVRLDKLSAGGPHTLVVQGKNKVTLVDVMVGEVWLASGQSNMVHIMPYSLGFNEESAKPEAPGFRFFTIARAVAQTPQENCLGNWLVCGPKTVDDVSAVAYYFGRAIHEKLDVPVGVIVSALGSTPIEAWTSLEAQQSCPELNDLLASWNKKAADYDPVTARTMYEKEFAVWQAAAASSKAAKKPVPREPKAPIAPREQPQHPAVMYNGMIAPLVPFACRGALWYQGEYNAQTEEYAALYRRQMPLLIGDWRARWDRPDMPWGIVQLPNFDTTTRTPVMTGWPLVREGQFLAGKSLSNTGVAVTTDLGEPTSIHPRNKRDIGRRLALWARAEVYGENVSWSGPVFESFDVRDRAIELPFQHTDGGLTARGGELTGFEIAGRDRKWHRAIARIEGDKVVVSSDDVREPIAARYSWAANPDGNLYNAAGLPASPFRTDRR